jgi:gamma-glutamyltranspeptidase/glutathione hydrolase
LIEPRTGTFLHNRGIGFSTAPGHVAAYAPGRRPPTTLSPTLVTGADGSFHACVGTMGGDVQPQVVAQLLARLLLAGETPGATVHASRWVLSNREDAGFSLWGGSGPDVVGVESDAIATWGRSLTARGHDVAELLGPGTSTGHAHVIQARTATLAGAAEPRAGGAAVGY